MESVSYITAFTAGLLSIASPCVWPLIPSYVSFITGRSLEELTAADRSWHAWVASIVPAIGFVIGFGLIFVLLGASATVLGQWLGEAQFALRKIGGALIIAFGLHELGWLKLPVVDRERRWQLTAKPWGICGSFLVGMVFALGWSPCIGPILAAILLHASSSASVQQGVMLLAIYSLGLGMPFLIAALLLDRFLVTAQWMRQHARVVSIVSGSFLIVVGLLIATDLFARLTGYLAALFPAPR